MSFISNQIIIKFHFVFCENKNGSITGQLIYNTTGVSLVASLSNLNDQAMITITGPVGKWFGVGFGAKTFKMSDQPYTIVVDGSGEVSEYKLGDHSKGQILAKSIKLEINGVINGKRTILFTRN